MSTRTALIFKGTAAGLTTSTLLLLGAFLISGTGCSKKSGTGSSAMSANSSSHAAQTPARGGMRKTWGLHVLDQPGSTFHVEYSDKTTIVDMATVSRALRGVTEDHSIFLFEDSPELRAKLIPGKYVLFEGLDLRKVDALAIDPKTKNLVVGTETPSLREALKSANIKFSAPVDFGNLFNQLAEDRAPLRPKPDRLAQVLSPSRWWDWIQPTAYADFNRNNVEGEAEYSDSDFAKWKCHYHYSANADNSLNLDTHLEREANGLNVDLDIKGHVSPFTQESSLVLTSEGQLLQTFKNGGMHGDVDFKWTIKTSENKTPMDEVRFKLPGKLSIPLAEFTELPMSLQISEAMLFHPAFTTKEEVAKGGFHVTYSGDEGIKIENQDMEQDGEAQGDGGIDETFAFSPFSAFGLVVAVAAPRIELRMGAEELFEMAEIPISSSAAESLTDVLLKNTIAGQWLNKKVGNPLAIEGAAYFQVVLSTTAAHSGMQSLVPCQQFTLNARAQVGVDAQWLGSNSNWPAKDIFTKDLIRRQPDATICGAPPQG